MDEKPPDDNNDVLVFDGECYAVGFYRPDAKAWDSCSFGWLENRSEPPIGIGTVKYWAKIPEVPGWQIRRDCRRTQVDM